MEQRLQKILAGAGVSSRRAAELLIGAGRVTVNGRQVTEPGTKADPQRDDVRLDGQPLALPERFTYVMLHKPRGYTSTLADEHAKQTLTELLPPDLPRVFPVGRLDRDSEGLLLLTNDGELTERLLHPRYHVEKEYAVMVRGMVTQTALERLRRGVVVDGQRTAPAEVEAGSPPRFSGDTGTPELVWLRFVLHEGRKRQIREMCAMVGWEVVRLARLRVGPILLGSLREGQIRTISDTDASNLRRACGLNPFPLLPGTTAADGVARLARRAPAARARDGASTRAPRRTPHAGPAPATARHAARPAARAGYPGSAGGGAAPAPRAGDDRSETARNTTNSARSGAAPSPRAGDDRRPARAVTDAAGGGGAPPPRGHAARPAARAGHAGPAAGGASPSPRGRAGTTANRNAGNPRPPATRGRAGTTPERPVGDPRPATTRGRAGTTDNRARPAGGSGTYGDTTGGRPADAGGRTPHPAAGRSRPARGADERSNGSVGGGAPADRPGATATGRRRPPAETASLARTPRRSRPSRPGGANPPAARHDASDARVAERPPGAARQPRPAADRPPSAPRDPGRDRNRLGDISRKPRRGSAPRSGQFPTQRKGRAPTGGRGTRGSNRP